MSEDSGIFQKTRLNVSKHEFMSSSRFVLIRQQETLNESNEERRLQHRRTLVKLSLHNWFPHAFTALRCNYLLLTLIKQNQGKL